MPTYEAQVTVQITRQYEIVLRVGAMNLADAEDLLRWKALGMKQKECDLHCDADAGSYYDGEMTVVDAVGQIEVVPEGEGE